jgi:hypoxanthine phosphoribosyltransferase
VKAEKRCEYISWNRFYGFCAELHRRIAAAGFRPDMIVGIARGGYMPARVLADFFDTMNLAAIKVEHYHGPRKSSRAIVRYPLPVDITGQRVLVVDDVSDSGDSFKAALAHLRDCGDAAELRTAVLHHKLTSSYLPDFHAARIVKWRWIVYPWAVTEDLNVLLGKMSDRPASVTEAERFLRERHGLAIPKRVLALVADNLGLAR